MKKVRLIFFEPGQQAGHEGGNVLRGAASERRAMCRARIQQAR